MRTVCAGALDGSNIRDGIAGVFEGECVVGAVAAAGDAGRHVGWPLDCRKLLRANIAVCRCTGKHRDALVYKHVDSWSSCAGAKAG